jgi:hypothetical protein
MGLAVGGSIVWGIQAPPPAWYRVEHTADWFVAAFTGLLVLVTAFLVLSTNKLWKSDERRFALEQRPWLQATVDLQHGPIMRPNERLMLAVQLMVRNAGKSPALAASIVVNWVPYSQLNSIQSSHAVPVTKEATGDVMFPGEEDTSVFYPWMPAKAYDEPGNGRYNSLLAISLYYRDGVGQQYRTTVFYTLFASRIPTADQLVGLHEISFRRLNATVAT